MLESSAQAVSVSATFPGECKECVLFFGYAVTSHTLFDLGDLGQDILACNVSDPDNAKTYSQTCALSPQPSPGSGYHPLS